MALDQYNREGQEMYNQYGLLSDQEQQDYGRYRDSYADWLAERDYATGRYDSERNFDYGKYVDDRNFGYQVHTDEQDRAWNEYVTAIQNAQWETSRQDKLSSESKAYARDEVMAVLESGGTVSDAQLAAAGMSRETADALSNAYKNAENNLKAGKELSANDIKGISSQVADLVENENLEAAEAYLTMLISNGYITEDEAKSFLAGYVITEDEEDGIEPPKDPEENTEEDPEEDIWVPSQPGASYPVPPLDPSKSFEEAIASESADEAYERILKNILGIK
jgi:hypothetical protein